MPIAAPIYFRHLPHHIADNSQRKNCLVLIMWNELGVINIKSALMNTNSVKNPTYASFSRDLDKFKVRMWDSLRKLRLFGIEPPCCCRRNLLSFTATKPKIFLLKIGRPRKRRMYHHSSLKLRSMLEHLGKNWSWSYRRGSIIGCVVTTN